MDIFEASRVGDSHVVKELIESGVNVNTRNTSQITPLMSASSAGFFEIVKYLIEKGADVNAKCLSGNTALHFASRYADFDIVSFLLEQGANVNERNRLNDTSLIYCCSDTSDLSVTTAKMLIRYGVELDATDKYGWTALMVATSKENVKLARLLIENGASLHIKNNNFHTAFQLSISRKYHNLTLLFSKYADRLEKSDHEKKQKFFYNACLKKGGL